VSIAQRLYATSVAAGRGHRETSPRMGKASTHQTDLKVSATARGFRTAPVRQDARSKACPSLMGLSRQANGVPNQIPRCIRDDKPWARAIP